MLTNAEVQYLLAPGLIHLDTHCIPHCKHTCRHLETPDIHLIRVSGRKEVAERRSSGTTAPKPPGQIRRGDRLQRRMTGYEGGKMCSQTSG